MSDCEHKFESCPKHPMSALKAELAAMTIDRDAWKARAEKAEATQ